MNSIEQLKVALGEPLKRNLGGQEFEFYPLPITDLVDLQVVFQNLIKNNDTLTKEDLITLTELMIKMVKNVFPKETPDDLINQFVIKYYYQLQEILTELHSPNIDQLDEKQKSRLEQLKAKIAQKNA